MAETEITQQIRLAIGSRKSSRFFRNNCGALPDRNGRLVQFGLFEGSGDLIGIETVTITPDMVGTELGVFCSIEVKKEGRDTTTPKRREAQAKWRDMVNSRGGRAGIARTVEEALRIVSGNKME